MHPVTFALRDYIPSTMITLTSHYYTQHTPLLHYPEMSIPLHHILPKRNILFLGIRLKNHELLISICKQKSQVTAIACCKVHVFKNLQLSVHLLKKNS